MSLSLLALTLIATAVAFFKLSWTYQAESNVALLPSQVAAKAVGGNPYMALSGSLNQIGDVIRFEVSDMREQNALAAAGYTSGYSITDAINTSAPVLLVTVTGKSPAEVEHTLTGVTQAITTQLATQQANVKPAAKIRYEVITFDTQPTRLTSKKARPLLVVLVVGLLLTYTIPMIVDAIQVGRGRSGRGSRKEASRPAEGVEQPAVRPTEWAQSSRQADAGLSSVSPADSTPDWLMNATTDARADDHSAWRNS